jgi:hypothetical protein
MQTTANNLSWLLRQTDFRSTLTPTTNPTT